MPSRVILTQSYVYYYDVVMNSKNYANFFASNIFFIFPNFIPTVI